LANIRDVAKLAGVSIGTVSRAFNGYSDISADTKQRIFDAAEQLHYTPNIIGRSLSSKVSPVIGMIVSGLLSSNENDHMLFSLEKGIYRYTLDNNLEVAIYATDSDHQRSKSYAQFCRERSLSGAVLSGITMDDAYLHDLISSNIPCVTIDVPIAGKRTGCVTIDDFAAEAEMTEYLFDQNHRKLFVIAGKKNTAVTANRLAGIQQVCGAHGVSLPRERVAYCDFDENLAYEQTKRHLQTAEPGVTAFVCMSDLMAIGTMRAITELGYKVPEDFSVTGFDNIPLASYVQPSLTTVSQNIMEKGYSAARLLRQIALDEPYERELIIPHKLCVRASVRRLCACLLTHK